jgi:hypothetical protein
MTMLVASKTFRWADGFHIKGDAQQIGEYLDTLRPDDSWPTAPEVVDAARPKSSPLHTFFEWNNKIAGEKFREEQARYMLRSIHVLVEHSNTPNQERYTRAFLPIRGEEKPREMYVPFAEVMSREDFRAQAVKRAGDEMLAFRRKYSDIKEFAAVFEAIDKTLGNVAV